MTENEIKMLVNTIKKDIIVLNIFLGDKSTTYQVHVNSKMKSVNIERLIKERLEI